MNIIRVGGNEGKLSTALKDIINYSPHTHSSTIHIIDYDFSRMVKSNNGELSL